MKPAILAFLACLGLCAQQAGLEGIAVDAVTQLPLAGVHVSLISIGAGTNLPDPDDAYGAVSNAAGHYSIGNIRPGNYTLEPKRAGYVYFSQKNPAAAPSLVLKAGEQAGGYRIAMTPESTIRGHVVDEFGDPVQGVAVRAVSATDDLPYGLWRMSAETDDRGEFRITGMPGKYYIEASVHALETTGPPEVRTDGSLSTAYATTYYPGALAKERGKVVEAGAGQLVTGIDIHVAHRRSLKISGKVTGAQVAGGTVTILLRHDNGEAEDDTPTGADGSFVFSGLAPSDYWLRASVPSGIPGSDPLQSPVVKVTIETDDATVSLPVTAGDVLAGTLRVEGESASEPWTVRLTPEDSHGTPTKGGQVATDGTFVISRVIPGIYVPEIDPLPDNSYVKSLRFGGVDHLREVDLTKGVGGSTMNITVSRNGGQLTGAIRDAQGQPLASRHLFVVLAEDPAVVATWRTVLNTGVANGTNSGVSPGAGESTFAIYGIRPGKYRLFAIDPLQFSGLRSYEQLKGVAALAEEIEIKEGDRLMKDLRVMGKEGPGAK